MTTTDRTMHVLLRNRDEHRAAGRVVEAQRVDQQVIAQQTLTRLHAERTAAVDADDDTTVAAVDQQIRFWERQVDTALIADLTDGGTTDVAATHRPEVAAAAPKIKGR